jgi:hypothetical protein
LKWTFQDVSVTEFVLPEDYRSKLKPFFALLIEKLVNLVGVQTCDHIVLASLENEVFPLGLFCHDVLARSFPFLVLIRGIPSLTNLKAAPVRKEEDRGSRQ